MPVRLALAASLLVLSALASASAETAPTPAADRLTVAQAEATPDRPQRRSRTRAQGAQKREPTARQMATRERQRKCSAEWKEAKAAGKVAAGMKWPQFWSRCNARLKGNEV